MNSDTTLTHLQTFYTRYEKDQLDHLADVYPDICSFTIDYNNLERFDLDVAELLESDPDRFLKCAHEALKDMELGVNKTFCCNIRIENYYRKIGINDIRSHHIGTFFTIEGIVAQITPVMPRMTEAAFDCQRCGTTTMEVQTVDKLSYPLECCNEMCTGKGLYKIDYDESTIKDFQMIRLQELPETLKGGEQPHSVDVLVTDDLVGSILPGEVATFSGILRAISSTKSRDFELEFEVNHIVQQEGYADMDITDEDIEAIQHLAGNPDIHGCLARSIAPAIFDMDNPKLAIVYHLFSGVPKTVKGSHIRGDIHVLLVGDPGIAKSQLLRYAVTISPRGVLASGRGSSAVGLTAAVVQNDLGDKGKWTLVAGVVVIASGGSALIDELDKMSKEDSSALHEAMEQQTVTIAKANIRAVLPAKSGIVAAANPRDGKFDLNEPLVPQVNLPPALLGRFDLTFILPDRVNTTHDEQLVDSVLVSHETWQNPIAIKNEFIDPALFRKYISYARRINPALTLEASAILRAFYLTLRKKAKPDSVPATPRQLEAVIRISEASARIRLSDVVSAEDAQRACDITMASLKESIEDDEGNFDFGLIAVGKSISDRDAKKAVRSIIKALMKNSDINQASEADIYHEGEVHGITVKEIKGLMREMSRDGELLSPKKGSWKLI